MATNAIDENNNNNKKERNSFNGVRLSKQEKKILNQLVLDTITYDFNLNDSLSYIEKRLNRTVHPNTYRNVKNQIEKGTVAEEWLMQFSKVGFAIVHQELFNNAINNYRDTNFRIVQLKAFMNADKTKNQYLEKRQYYDDYMIRLKQLQIQQANEVLRYTLGTPVIAQMKALIRKEVILEERDRMIIEGNLSVEDANYSLAKNIFNEDMKKGRFNITEVDKGIISSTEIDNEDKQQQRSTGSLFSSTEGIAETREESTIDRKDTISEPTNKSNVPDVQSPLPEQPTNYGFPDPQQQQRIKADLLKRKSKFIQ